MKLRNYLIILTIGMVTTHCTADFIIDDQQVKSVLTVEGWITNSGEPAFVRLLESTMEGPQYYSSDSNYGGLKPIPYVDDAIIIISSNSQAPDTMRKTPYLNLWDGFFVSKNIKGIAGETYYLQIIFQDAIYEAESYMPIGPTIDSITFQRKQIEKENANLYIPMVNFTDPGGVENYYLFKDAYFYLDSAGKEYWNTIRGGDPWMISLFSDKFIDGKNAQLNVRSGITIERYWLDGNFWLRPNDQIGIQMQSITKDTYEFYLALINQLNYAAGVFHPAPTSPPTNISNGGQGFFMASSVSNFSTIVPSGE